MIKTVKFTDGNVFYTVLRRHFGSFATDKINQFETIHNTNKGLPNPYLKTL